MPNYKTYRVELRLFFKKSIYCPDEIIDDNLAITNEICEILNQEVPPTQPELDAWMQTIYMDDKKRYEDFVEYLYVCSYGKNLKNIEYHPGGKIVFEISENTEIAFNSSKEEVIENILTDSFEDGFYEGMPGSTAVFASKILPDYESGLIECRQADCILVEEI